MYDNLFTSLTKNFYTVQEIHLAIRLLKEFFDSYFFKGKKKENVKDALKKFLKERNDLEYTVRALLSLSDDFYNAFEQESAASIFDTLEKKTDKCEQIVLYVPILLPGEETKKIGEWIRTNVSKSALIDLKVDRFATGGCAFVLKGVYYDFSLRYFLKKKEREITQMIHSYRKEHESR